MSQEVLFPGGGGREDARRPELVVVRHRPGAYARWGKPVLDRTLAVALAVVLAPVVTAVTLAVWLGLGAPILYRQQRVGLGGVTFRMLKFRTMAPDRRQGRSAGYVGPERRRTHKTPDDPRHTRLGRFLRRTSLDELPQLWNVVRGEMSLVGPRPELVEIVGRYEPWQHRRHLVKPGLTGLWQVTQRANGEGLMHLHTATDLQYVDNLGFRTDMRILWRTIPSVLGLGPRD
jgi:lipopolysaccharide/colanic/teichoic acid biosynthesis glycosyltransferase